MPTIPIQTPLGYIGVFLIIAGLFLVIAGFDILKIEKLTIATGVKTWSVGLILASIGTFFLMPDINNALSPAPTPPTLTPTATMPATNTPMPLIITSTNTVEPVTLTPTLQITGTPTLTPTNTPTSTPTAVHNSSILLLVYWDRDNNGLREGSDWLLSSSVLELYAGSSCSGTVIAVPLALGGFKFVNLAAGVYCVKVINNSVDDVGYCPLVPRNNRNEKVYSIRENQDLEDLHAFPYVCQ